MLLTTAVLSLLAAAPSSEPVRLAAVPLTGIGIDAKRAEFFNDYVAQRLTSHGILVTTPSTVQAILGHERQKALLGCASEGDEATRCLVEMSGALGVDGLVVGSVAQLAQGAFAVNLKVVSAKDGSPLAAESGRVDSEGALLDFFGQASRELAIAVRSKLGRGAPVERGSFLAGTRRWSWIPGVVAVGTGVTAAVFYAQARGAETELRTAAPTIANSSAALTLKQSGEQKQTVAVALMATGIVSLGVAATMFAFGADGSEDVALVVAPTTGGTFIHLSGSLP